MSRAARAARSRRVPRIDTRRPETASRSHPYVVHDSAKCQKRPACDYEATGPALRPTTILRLVRKASVVALRGVGSRNSPLSGDTGAMCIFNAESDSRKRTQRSRECRAFRVRKTSASFS